MAGQGQVRSLGILQKVKDYAMLEEEGFLWQSMRGFCVVPSS